MKKRDLEKAGIPRGECMDIALQGAIAALRGGMSKREVLSFLAAVADNPSNFLTDPLFAALAARLARPPREATARIRSDARARAPYRIWGDAIDKEAVAQMDIACSLPVAVRGALMPDAHVGYGLPIGGVLAVRDAVIPYAVGVDIACRMKISVLDLPLSLLCADPGMLKRALREGTLFGVGAAYTKRRQHPVMDADWSVSPLTRELKDFAWGQLGTSGSGNHFVEFGILTVDGDGTGLSRGAYLALLSHSGSRGTGAKVASHYSNVAMQKHRELSREFAHLAWLDLGSHEGGEYWAAMELMGRYAAANHAIIHEQVASRCGARVIVEIENHHNFAWKEEHDGKRVIVHRKGATPAAPGMLGIIPGSMGSPGFIVKGKGNEAALASAAHGAGRAMSRTEAKRRYRWSDAQTLLDAAGVTVLSAGIDEIPQAYKNILDVMAAQADLVETVARFDPKIVKMAPAGERAED